MNMNAQTIPITLALSQPNVGIAMERELKIWGPRDSVLTDNKK